MMKGFLLVIILVSLAESFVVDRLYTVARSGHLSCGNIKFASCSSKTTLKSLENDDNVTENKLNSLGFSKQEIQRSQKSSDKEERKVQVNLLPEIDSVTLTAVGFALIAFNFFVLANLEDGGIAGVVASVINYSRQ
jgi:hypothetical protein